MRVSEIVLLTVVSGGALTASTSAAATTPPPAPQYRLVAGDDTGEEFLDIASVRQTSKTVVQFWVEMRFRQPRKEPGSNTFDTLRIKREVDCAKLTKREVDKEATFQGKPAYPPVLNEDASPLQTNTPVLAEARVACKAIGIVIPRN